LIGSVVAVAQAGTTWIDGYWKTEQAAARAQLELDLATKKGEQDLRLAKVRDESALSMEYLKLILAKDTTQADRSMLYGVLERLTDHPLQRWAAERAQQQRSNEVQLLAAYEQQRVASQILDDSDREIALLKGEVEERKVRLQEASGDPTRRETLHAQILTKEFELVKLQERRRRVAQSVTTSTVLVEESRSSWAQSEQTILAAQISSKPAETSDTSLNRVTASLLRVVASGPNNELEIYAPLLQSAMREAGLGSGLTT